MTVEKLVTFQAPSSAIIDQLTHALIAEGFSLVEFNRKTGIVSGTMAMQKFIQNITVSTYPIPEGCLVRFLCTARSETSAPGLESGDLEDEQGYEEPCHKMIKIILGQINGWREVSRGWVEDREIQLENPRTSRRHGHNRLARNGVWVGLTAAAVGGLLAFLTLSERVKLASPQVWIMVAVIGVFVFCFGLFNLIWRR